MLEKQDKPENIKIDNINEILYKNCCLEDQYQNDEEKEDYEESISQMVQTIKILHEQKTSTPWVNYKNDLKLAFGPKSDLQKKNDLVIEAKDKKDDGNFDNSSISRNDFYLYGLYIKIKELSGQDVNWEELVKIKCTENHSGAIRIDDFDDIGDRDINENADIDANEEMIPIHKFIKRL